MSTGSGSPCGACKFLRRKCVKGCIFAPYFCYEQGATHFAGIHKVFGASNVSKLLAHLQASDRCEAAVTLSYEAQARLQDPIYGCVSHILALQQQVVNLQTQLAFMREQAAHENLFNNDSAATENPNGNKIPFYEKLNSSSEDFVHISNFYDFEHSNYMLPQFNSVNNPPDNHHHHHENNVSYYSFEEASNMPSLEMQTNNNQWGFKDADDHEFQSMTSFSHMHHP